MDVPISRDIRKYKSKDIGNFSFGQAAFLAGGVAAGFLTYKFVSPSIEICCIPIAIILVFGFFKPYGMSLFAFLKLMFNELILSPRNLFYESDFEVDEEFVEAKIDEGYAFNGAMFTEVIQTEESSAPKKIKRSKDDKQRLAR